MLRDVGELLRSMVRVHRHRWWWDRREIGYVRAVLRRGDTAVDVGAYKGGYTYWMHRCVGREGRVFAFEPQPGVATYLQRIKRLMRMDNVTIENAAISSGVGASELVVPGRRDRAATGSTASPGARLDPRDATAAVGHRHTVRTETLDHYFERLIDAGASPKIRLIKVDVEGHELEVFKGGVKTLSDHHPALIVECERRHHDGDSISPVFDLLADLGYRGSSYFGGERRGIDSFDDAKHQNRGEGEYVNNFIFERSTPATITVPVPTKPTSSATTRAERQSCLAMMLIEWFEALPWWCMA